ncbi:MAG: MarR family transcriptional regulator [Hyphomicrobiales bacterium]|nr:MarR family transcriptional regulator [Hyphomicrobiales bacterium]
MNQDRPAFRLMNEIGIIDQLGKAALEAVLPDGLTVPQFIILNHFVRLGGQRSPSELARAFQVTKGTMTSTLQRLEAKRFIEILSDPEDGRGKRVRITAAGIAARERSIQKLQPVLDMIDQAIGREAIQSLLPVLTQLRIHLDAARDVDGRVLPATAEPL